MTTETKREQELTKTLHHVGAILDTILTKLGRDGALTNEMRDDLVGSLWAIRDTETRTECPTCNGRGHHLLGSDVVTCTNC